MSRFTNPLTQDKSNSVLLTISCFTAVFPHFFHTTAWVIAGSSFALIWRLWLVMTGRKLPATLLLLPYVCLMMAGVWISFHTFLGKEAGVTMLILLISCKLLEMHAKRDLYVAVFLAYFLLLTSYLYNQTIFSGTLSILSVLLLTTSLSTFQYTSVIPPLSERLSASVRMLLTAIPVMLIGFFLFPRIPGPLWGLPSDEGHGKSGLSDSLNPGNISDLALNEDIAFRVKFHNYPKDKSVLYWRGIVLDDYDGRSWKASAQSKASTGQIPPPLTSKSGIISYDITLEPHQKKWLFGLDMPESAPAIPGNPALITPNMELRANTPIISRQRYSLRSYTVYHFSKNIDPAEKQLNTLLPHSTNPKTRLFARQLRRQSTSDVQYIQSILAYFTSQQFEYTLHPGKAGLHAIDEFLFVNKKGFCEHYASAFTFLMREAGIPARIVTGYQGGMQNPIDDYFEVRQSDAHAWTEVWLPATGWTRIDPTATIAPERIHQSFYQANSARGFAAVVSSVFQNQSWPQYVQMYWDATNNEWNQWILGYGQQKQENLLRSFDFDQLDLQKTGIAAVSAASVLFVAAALLSVLRRRKQLNAESLYKAFCEHMAARGVAKAAHESPTIFLERIKQTLPKEKLYNIEEFLHYYSRYCYAGHNDNEQASFIRLKNILYRIQHEQ
jgi:transglutaminase-like putative cysteine protease